MKFDELFQYDLKPFIDYVTVAKAKEIGAIPERFSDVFVDVCVCGSDMMARMNGKSVTAITCCDPGCYVKIGYQVAEIFSKYGHKGVGVQTCKKLVSSVLSKKGSVSLYDVLVDGLYYSELGDFMEEEFGEALTTMRGSRISFGRFVSRLSYPFLGDRFEEVLSGVNGFSDLMDKIRGDGGLLVFFSNRGVRDVNTVFCFAFFAEEIRRICEEFSESIIASSEKKIPICLTGRMGTAIGVLTKADFLDKCNLLVMTKDGLKDFDIVSVESVSKAAFVVVGEDSVARGTNKYRTAKALEDQLRMSGQIGDEEKFIFKPDEFLQYLLKGGVVDG